MKRWAALMGSIIAALAGVFPALTNAWSCELQVLEHRSSRELQRLTLDPINPQFALLFEHSVLGSTVIDTYRVRGSGETSKLWLIQERFTGEGYGLPHTAGPQEQLLKDADNKGWTLTLNRLVDPLVVRPQPQTNMRLMINAQSWLLTEFLDSHAAVQLISHGCNNKELNGAVR